jgi:hypothetical protein
MEAKKSKTKENKSTENETMTQPTVIQDINHLDEAIGAVDSAIFHLNKQYELKAENPISSVLISLELIKMNLNKIKTS